jgi:formate dehydrogenase maturation protein FdhE
MKTLDELKKNLINNLEVDTETGVECPQCISELICYGTVISFDGNNKKWLECQMCEKTWLVSVRGFDDKEILKFC